MDDYLKHFYAFLDTKTVHSFDAVYSYLIGLFTKNNDILTTEELASIQQLINEFQSHSQKNSKNSWGRSELKKWLNNYLNSPFIASNQLSEELIGQSLDRDVPPFEVVDKVYKDRDLTHVKGPEDYCSYCHEHRSQCTCTDHEKEEFSFLIDGELYAITRGEAFTYRKRGLELFKKYTSKWLNNEQVKNWVMRAMEAAPLYYWVIPSSSSGKYHNKETNSIFGLVKHALATGYFAKELCRTFNIFDINADLTVAAALIHDNVKYGIDYDIRYYECHTCILSAYYGRHQRDILKYLPEAWAEYILKCVETHNGSMTGEWCITKGLAPQTPSQMVVHLADMVSSRADTLWRGWSAID